MSTEKLKFLSNKVATALRDTIKGNLERYQRGNFSDLVDEGGWSIELSLDADLAPLRNLEHGKGAEAEIKNSLLVWRALSHMAPSLARENRVWTRLTHVECLEYSRARWLSKSSDEEDAVRIHFFADTQTKCRDDNAIGRLWWNAYIANSAIPGNLETALKAMLKSADIRSNIVERTWSASRPKVAAGLLRAIIQIPDTTSSEDAFRSFMKTVNMRGGGVLFELMDDNEIDSFMAACVG